MLHRRGRRLTPFALFSLFGLLAVVSANPLSKLFMMKRKDDTKTGPAPQEASPPTSTTQEASPPSSNDTRKDCIPLESLTQAHDQIRTLKNDVEEALRESTKSAQLAEQHKSDFEDYRKTTEMKMQQLSQASENAVEISRLQSEFAARLAEIQAKAESELAAAKAESAAKEYELVQSRQKTKQLEERIQNIDNEWRANLSDQENRNREFLQQVRLNFEKKTKKAEEENAILVGEKIALETKVQLLNEKHEQTLKDHEVAIKRKLDKIKENEASAALLQQTKELVVAKEEVIQQLGQKMLSEKEASDAAMAELQAQMDETQQSGASARKRLKADLRAAIDESRTLKAQMEDMQAKLDELAALHEKSVSDFVGRLREADAKKASLEKGKAELQTALDVVKEQYSQAVKDAKHWEDKFTNRPYVDLTHVANDAYAYAAQTTQSTSATIARAAAPVTEKIVPITKQVYEAHVVPPAVKSKELYDLHMKTHVDKAITETAFPIYNAHIAPHLKMAKTTAVELGERSFDTLTTRFESFCPTALESFKSTQTKMGMKLPPSVMEAAVYSCDHPEEEVALFLKGFVILMALIFHRMIFRVIFGTVRLIVRIVWFFTPLRWFLALFRSAPPPAAEPSPEKQNNETNGTPSNGANKVKRK